MVLSTILTANPAYSVYVQKSFGTFPVNSGNNYTAIVALKEDSIKDERNPNHVQVGRTLLLIVYKLLLLLNKSTWNSTLLENMECGKLEQ